MNAIHTNKKGRIHGNVICFAIVLFLLFILILICVRWEGANVIDFQLLLSYVKHIFSFVFDLWAV